MFANNNGCTCSVDATQKMSKYPAVAYANPLPRQEPSQKIVSRPIDPLRIHNGKHTISQWFAKVLQVGKTVFMYIFWRGNAKCISKSISLLSRSLNIFLGGNNRSVFATLPWYMLHESTTILAKRSKKFRYPPGENLLN